MPFLLDSTLAEITEQRPRSAARRPSDPRRRTRRRRQRCVAPRGEALRQATQPGTRRESFIHVHLDRLDDASRRERAGRGARARLCRRARRGARLGRDARAASTEAIAGLPLQPAAACRTTRSPRRSPSSNGCAHDNFTFLGMREYRFPAATSRPIRVRGHRPRHPVRSRTCGCCGAARELVMMTPEIRAFLPGRCR